jgi:ubiquinol-cytochrome c reductase cytochrome b subunit
MRCRLAAPNRLRAAPCQSSPTPVVGPTPPMQDHPHHLLVHIGWPTGASYPTPSNLSYFWGLGSLAAICFSAMMATGGLLATGYLPLPPVAFFSVERISRSVPSGWLSRCLHGCGASAFLAVVHLHLFRGWGRIPSPARRVWWVGVPLLLLLLSCALMGYVLPWGQMGFWGGTAVTGLASAIPLLGVSLVTWLSGGFSLDGSTLNRFSLAHALLPPILAALSWLHLALLHLRGSSTPLAIPSGADRTGFLPGFYLKDLVGVVALTWLFPPPTSLHPLVLRQPDTSQMATPMSTP